MKNRLQRDGELCCFDAVSEWERADESVGGQHSVCVCACMWWDDIWVHSKGSNHSSIWSTSLSLSLSLSLFPNPNHRTKRSKLQLKSHHYPGLQNNRTHSCYCRVPIYTKKTFANGCNFVFLLSLCVCLADLTVPCACMGACQGPTEDIVIHTPWGFNQPTVQGPITLVTNQFKYNEVRPRWLLGPLHKSTL